MHFFRLIWQTYFLYSLRILFLLLLSLSQIAAQNPYKNYILNNDMPQYKSLNSLSDYYKTHDFHSPLINRIDLRSESHEYKLNQQEYSLRFRFTSPKYNSYQNKLNLIEQEFINIEFRSIENHATYLKYKSVLDFMESKELNELHLKSNNLREKSLNNAKLRLDYTNKTNLENYFEEDLNYQKSKRAQAETEFKLTNLSKEIGIELSDTRDKDHRITVAFIKNALDTFKIINISIETDKLNSTLQKIKIKLDQDKSEANKILDFVQLKYQSDPEDLLSKKLSAGISLRIPYLTMSKALEENSKIKEFQTQFNLESDQNKKQLKVNSIYIDIRNQIHAYELLQHSISVYTKTYDFDQMVNIGFTDTDLILKIMIQQTKYEMELKELEFKIFNRYIDFLYYTDQFYINPNRYYLSQS
ncbi:MAG: hypothetical protein IPO86_10290 [Saprospiraceae bacterium]|nr:hypothetical protein [Saprospiraceae bacterium]